MCIENDGARRLEMAAIAAQNRDQELERLIQQIEDSREMSRKVMKYLGKTDMIGLSLAIEMYETDLKLEESVKALKELRK